MKGFIPNDIIEKIRSSSDIVEVIEEHVLLKKSGKNYIGLCPFHPEKTPSFSVSQEKQIYHCFGCGEGGNSFSFLMKFNSLSFPEAAIQLGKRYGIVVPTHVRDGKLRSHSEFQDDKSEKYFAINRFAAEYFHKNLLKEKCGNAAREYLRSRNISSDTVKKFFLGYADKNWDSLLIYFQKKNFDLKELEKAGLVKSKESGTGYYDRLRDRIIFPIITRENKICGFGGRDISFDEKAPKYINSPGSIIYNKGEILFGFDSARENIRKKGFVIIVEGYFDLVSLCQYGFNNVVATCGTALTNKQAGLIRRFTNNVILLFDSDEAGYKATTRGFEVLLEYSLNVKVIDLPENTDPDDFINQFGLDQFQEKIRKSFPFIEYIANKLKNKINLNSLEERVNCVNTILPFLAKIKNSIERTAYISTLTEIFRVSEKSFLKELRNAIEGKKPNIAPNNLAKTEKRSFDRFECYLIRFILLYPGNIEKVKLQINSNYFSDANLKEIIEFLFELNVPGEQLSPQKIVEIMPGERNRKIVSELLMDANTEIENTDKALEELISSIIKKAKQKEIESLKKKRLEAANFKKIEEFQRLDKDLKALQGS